MSILQRDREFEDGSHSWLGFLMEPVRLTPRYWRIPEITITLIGGLVAGLWVAASVAVFALDTGNVLKPNVFSWQVLLIWVLWVVLHVFLAGENGVRFRIWLNLEPMLLRSIDTPIDLTPISRKSTRVVFFALLAVELGFLAWFQILKTRPALYKDWVLELYNKEPILFAYDQIYYYWWLLPVLCLLFAGALLGIEHLFGIRTYFRRTRLVILIAGVILPLFEVIAFFSWFDQIYPITLP